MKRKFNKKLERDDKGVSEIIADILILGITVSLFMVLFWFVWSIPTPTDLSLAEFEPNLLFDEGGTGAFINLTHVSGETVTGYTTDILLFKNTNEEILSLQTKGTYMGSDYGILESPNDNWDVGEKWTFLWSSITANDELDVRIVDSRSSTVVWQSTLLGAGKNDAPIIMDRHYSPRPAVSDSDITLFATVKDPDGKADITSVKADVSALNDTLDMVPLTDEDEDGTYECTIKVTSPVNSTPYTVTFYAKDGELTHWRRMDVRVTGSFDVRPVIIISLAEPNSVDPEEDAQFEVRAFVWDPQGNDNIDKTEVKIDLTSIGQGVQTMTENPANSGVFRYPSANTPSTKGDYVITVSAKDIDGYASENYTFYLHVIDDATSESEPPDPTEDWSIPKKLWDYIGFTQLDVDDLFWTHAGDWPAQGGGNPNFPDHWHPIYRINNKHIESDGMIWHLVANNHGNRTIFLDSHCTIRWQQGISADFRHIVSNDTTAYPHTGNPGSEGDMFEFAFDSDYVMDINKQSQEKGGPQLDIKFGAASIGKDDFKQSAGSAGAGNNPHALFVSMSGILGPENKTIQEILDHYGYLDISQYHPEDHVDEGGEWGTKWFGQLIPFLSIWVYQNDGTGVGQQDSNPEYLWPPPQPGWYRGLGS
jgi:FlaG/FlaF family flagellin (archaellin)